MTDMLLHPTLVVELLQNDPETRRQALLEQAEARGDGLWIPVAGIPVILESLSAGLRNSVVDAGGEARRRLKSLGSACAWLGSPAGDAELIDQQDLLEHQILAGLGRLGAGSRLLKLDADGSQVLALEEYLTQDAGEVPVPFIDLAFQQRRIRGNIESGLLGVLAHGKYIGGPEIDELEKRLAEFVGVRHALAISNGTDALLVALMAAGVSAGDEVITSPFTFAATGEMIHLLGARPVYVDIDPRTYNLDATRLAAAIGERTRVILPVSIFGQCADMETINKVAAAHGLPVIEDAAQSFGATHNGRRSGALADIGCTSFFPSKPLGGYGDSGACFTDDDQLAEAMRRVRDHGQSGRYHHTCLGINGRMSSFQASVLLAKLGLFEEEVTLRAEVAARYDQLFSLHASGLDEGALVLPYLAPGNTSVYAQYSLLVCNRDQVQAQLASVGIPTSVHYPIPLNRQPAMLDPSSQVPVCEDVASRVVSIPMHPYLREGQQHRVVVSVIDAITRAQVS